MSGFAEAVISSFIAAVLGGSVVVVAQQWYLNRREKKKEVQLRLAQEQAAEEAKRITFQNAERILTGDAIWRLKPGASMELMRPLLGLPLTHNPEATSDFDTFGSETPSEPSKKYHAYLYLFKNASVKICTADNLTIDAITIIDNMLVGNGVEVPTMSFALDDGPDKLGEAKVNERLIERCARHMYIATRIDSSFALQCWVPNPVYLNYTFFGFAPDLHTEYMESKDPSLFLDREIWGVCLSRSSDAFYIFDIETR